MLEVPGRLFATEGGTVLEKTGTLTKGTTVFQGPMMLYNGKPNKALDALSYAIFVILN